MPLCTCGICLQENAHGKELPRSKHAIHAALQKQSALQASSSNAVPILSVPAEPRGPGSVDEGELSRRSAGMFVDAFMDEGSQVADQAPRLWAGTPTLPSTWVEADETALEGVLHRVGDLAIEAELPAGEGTQWNKDALRKLALIKAAADECIKRIPEGTDEDSQSAFRDVRSRYMNLCRSLDAVKRESSVITGRKSTVRRDLDYLRDLLAEHPLADLEDGISDIDCHEYTDFPVDALMPLAQAVILLTVVCHVIAQVSRKATTFISATVCLLLSCVARDKVDKAAIEQVPLTLDSIISLFRLDGSFVTYASCGLCHALYKSDVHGEYPPVCTNREAPDLGMCGNSLLDEKQDPKRTFVLHSFEDYLAALIMRHEKLMDKTSLDLSSMPPEPSTVLGSVVDGEFLKQFLGPESAVPFCRGDDEGRYFFIVNVDFFDVETMTKRGATTSTGIISMACLNLPLDIRYKPENMYLAGLVKDPEPSLTQLNHYLEPVVDIMLKSYTQGLGLSNTPAYPQGRTVRCAVAAAVCDLQAARKLAQMAAPTSHHFCTVCECYHKDNLSDCNYHQWIRRNPAELRRYAEEWRAASSTEREALFVAHGVRWSVFWKLPYWDPARQLVVDAMHCLFENMADNHVREVLQMTVASASSSKLPPAFSWDFSLPTEAQMARVDDRDQVDKIHAALCRSIPGANDDEEAVSAGLDALEATLKGQRKAPLKFVYDDLALPGLKEAKKKDYILGLRNWRITQTLGGGSKFATPLVIETIRTVIRDCTVPTWVRTVPAQFASKRAGTIKADEWRTLFSIYLPIALIKVWGIGSLHDSQGEADFFRLALDVTMALVAAQLLACKDTVTRSMAEKYREHLAFYISNFQRLNPSATHRTNNHMAFHIYDFLLLFGPVRSWWCFPFERLIGQLQRVPSNHKPGQMEDTLVRQYVRAARLRSWISREDCPSILKKMKLLFDVAFSSGRSTQDSAGQYPRPVDDKRDDEQHKASRAKRSAIPAELAHIRLCKSAQFPARHFHNGVFFSRNSTHPGNSMVSFFPGGDETNGLVPACIEHIVMIGTQAQFAVRRYSSPAHPDPFQPYRPDFPAQLYSTQVREPLELIDPGWIHCHNATWKFAEDRIIVLQLL